jgi:hypothetical protein
VKVFYKLFGGLKMSWLFVIVFGLVAGIVTGIMGSIPAIAQTSFHDIAVSYEWWVIFAFIIAANCRKNWECALKTFLFFLISQPMCFATEVVAGSLTFDMAIYYYSAIWGPATLFTLLGGFIAFYITKQNVLGAVILGLGNTIQTLMGVHYFTELVSNPPYHLLTTILCFASAIIMTLVIQKEDKNRALTFVIMAVATIAVIAFTLLDGRVL